VYNKVSLLVQLWSLKIVRGEGRPFVAFEDLHLFALDTICAIAFGLNDHNILQQEIKCVEDNGFVVSHTSTDPINFLHAPRSSQVEALLDMSPMMSIAQKSPMPGLSQLCALLDPFHARACRYRRDILRAKTMKILPPSHNADTNKASVSTQNALDQMQIREHHIATKLGRLPNIYSAAIRDEVCTPSHQVLCLLFLLLGTLLIRAETKYGDIGPKKWNEASETAKTKKESKREK
jgi:hypothetical protein